MKKRLIVFSLIALILIGAAIYMGVSELNSPKSKLEIPEIGKSFTVVLEETSIRDYTCLDTEEFSLLKPEELNKLKEYMEKNHLKIKAGSYDFNQADLFNEMITILEFEK